MPMLWSNNVGNFVNILLFTMSLKVIYKNYFQILDFNEACDRLNCKTQNIFDVNVFIKFKYIVRMYDEKMS